MSPITTHVLDTSTGKPGAGIAVSLEYKDGTGWQNIASGTTDGDGRLRGLIGDGGEFQVGEYRLTFEVGEYFGSQGVECFFPSVTLSFVVKDVGQHYHVPLLVSPFGYSTYRGS
jgi:5-hydroxyisourate hydrolase